ncbi:MAG: hypothetical protein EAX95_06530 [Candidatus Thorarchaeota archaeon]|nr:hypothetical protein [Candidatus Thorarchaeota archaeon]
MSLTARDLLQRLAEDAGTSYKDIAGKVNEAMSKGEGLLESVSIIAIEFGLSPSKYRLDSLKIAGEISKLLREDYTQTLMVSAVLGQMVEAKGDERFPSPAFFAFLEILSTVPDARRDTKSETVHEIEELTTRIIELTTTLVSLICEWSHDGIVGVASDCPATLQGLARAVFRKTKLLQAGLWTCISCGKIVNVKDTRALVCEECDAGIHEDAPLDTETSRWERDRTGYGRTRKRDPLE